MRAVKGGMKITGAGGGKGPGPRHTHSLCQHLKDIDLVLQTEPLFKMLIESLLRLPVSASLAKLPSFQASRSAQVGGSLRKLQHRERRAAQRRRREKTRRNNDGTHGFS